MVVDKNNRHYNPFMTKYNNYYYPIMMLAEYKAETYFMNGKVCMSNI